MVIILRGISGSGKSTLAKIFIHADAYQPKPPGEASAYVMALGIKLPEHNKSSVSADNFFTSGSVYKFDGSKLAEAHSSCLLTFIDEIQQGQSIVVDNTNTTVAEVSPYISLAAAYKHEIHVLTLLGPPERLCPQNMHGTSFSSAVYQDLSLRESLRHWPLWFPKQKLFQA